MYSKRMILYTPYLMNMICPVHSLHATSRWISWKRIIVAAEILTSFATRCPGTFLPWLL